MPPLYPPEFPYRPDAPLLSFGPAFSEELSRSVLCAIWHDNPERPHETDVRTAAGLTMLEAFHPRDHLECMYAAQGVAAHCAIMDSFCRSMQRDTPVLVSIKERASAVQMNRMFSLIVRDLEHRQAKPLPERPQEPPSRGGPAPHTPTSGNPEPSDPLPVPEAAAAAKRSPRRSRATVSVSSEPVAAMPDAPQPIPLPNLEDLPEIPEDVATRPDGSPGNLAAYLSKAPVAQAIPREAPIMLALATRPKPWRMVNVPKVQAGASANPSIAGTLVPDELPLRRGPLDLQEQIFTGDALARFASARFDPDAPDEQPRFEDDESIVELELISTGGDPAAEAERAAMIAAHPEGKPIVTFRHGTKRPPDLPLPNGRDKTPPDGWPPGT